MRTWTNIIILITIFFTLKYSFSSDTDDTTKKAEKYKIIAKYYEIMANNIIENQKKLLILKHEYISNNDVLLRPEIIINFPSFFDLDKSPITDSKKINSAQDTNSNLDIPESIIEDVNKNYNKKPNILVKLPWKGTNIGIGGSLTTGNAATTNYNTNINLSYNPIIPWKNTLDVMYLYSRDNNSNTNNIKTDKLQSIGQVSWNFDKSNGIYSSINYTRDKLDTYTYVIIESIGYLRQLYADLNMELNNTLGPSLTQQKIRDSGQSSNAVGAQYQLNYLLNISQTSSFNQKIIVNFTGQDATKYQTISTLALELYNDFILQLSFSIDGSSWSSSDKKRVSTTTTTSLAYKF